ncbi:hypothetical protein EJB05_41344, partial [Eragrostis curvula]
MRLRLLRMCFGARTAQLARMQSTRTSRSRRRFASPASPGGQRGRPETRAAAYRCSFTRHRLGPRRRAICVQSPTLPPTLRSPRPLIQSRLCSGHLGR